LNFPPLLADGSYKIGIWQNTYVLIKYWSVQFGLLEVIYSVIFEVSAKTFIVWLIIVAWLSDDVSSQNSWVQCSICQKKQWGSFQPRAELEARKAESGGGVVGEGGSEPLPISWRVWGNAVSSPSGVRGRAQAARAFGVFYCSWNSYTRMLLPLDVMPKRGLCRRACAATFVYSVETSRHIVKKISYSGIAILF